ncbi:orotidine-5'-phosphate decarboxylase [Dinghuibacter silviterrae]|uniref:Orotidine-5'-phosphate decarboxylase n=1 Tax=Dinghuibacter silviterrae TaxID=1539049 RepID=A0A4R8DEB5_9BACT|nr:orotidine-5'-phosphate decarboxylase [Dinghuibacter silviterrae]TDW95765.1 orotidine-5'-phosphate decarboxylase [Dinghuibacter silviterrae]
MTRIQLIQSIRERGSYLCVGLDPDLDKVPAHLLGEEDPIFAFNKEIIDATRDLCVAYKLNTAFYECYGVEGWRALERTVSHIGQDHFLIADAKRGDIGNTSTQYAKAFFERLPFDAVTVAPYMGADSVKPFLAFDGKWAIVLGLTSNPGAADFELQEAGGMPLYERVLSTVSGWGHPDNLMFVVGATQASAFVRIRKLVPDHFLLVPGVGAQGGSLREISEKAANSDLGLLVNVSRGITYAGKGEDFASAARAAAQAYQQEMQPYVDKILRVKIIK